MAKVKKYQWGTFSASGASPQMVNPGNAALKQYTTTSSSSIPTSGDISQVAYTKDTVKGPSFKDKAGAFMGNYGGAITKAAGSLMPLLMKKPDPNAKPYKKGSKLIKYQAGTNNAATDNPEDLNAYFGRILGKNKTVQSSNEPQGEVGPTRKEAADLMRTYNKANKNNPKVIGKVDEEEITKREKELKNLTTSNKTKLPITYSKDTFAGPSKEELETDRNKEISENAERARKTYETRLDAEAARTQYEKEQAIEGEKNMVGPSREDLIKYKKDAEATEAAIKSGIPSSLTAPTFTKESVQRAIERQAGGPVSTEKNPILYKEPVKEKNPYISFKQMSAADQKAYRAGMASGKAFEVGGRKYAAATPEEIAFSKRMEVKSNRSTKPDTYYKDVYNSRKGTVGKNFGTTKTPFTGARETVVTSKKEEIKPKNNKQVNTNTQESSNNKTTVSEFNLKAIMAKKKELANLRSSVPGFGPFRSSSNSKLVEDIDNINRQLYKISQKQSAFERNKTRGLGDAQALKEAKARELEFKNLTKNLKFK